MSCRLLLGKIMSRSLKNFGKQLESLGHSYSEIGPEIFLIYNMIEDSEVSAIYKEIKNASQADWEKDYLEGLMVLGRRKYGRSDIENLIKEGLVEVTTSWIDKNIKLKNQIVAYNIGNRVNKLVKIISPTMHYDGISSIQRQYDGVDLVEHVDSHSDPDIEFAAILYVNDNYVDGEVFFSKLGIEIKPPAKSLLMFPSGEEYLHGVRAPGHGPHRYVLPSFIREKMPNAI